MRKHITRLAILPLVLFAICGFSSVLVASVDAQQPSNAIAAGESSIANAIVESAATSGDSAKSLEDVKNALDDVPTTIDLTQQIRDLNGVVQDSPTRRSERSGFWTRFYETNESYRSLEHRVKALSGESWLSPADHTALNSVLTKVSECRQSAECFPLTDLDQAISIVNERRSAWQEVKASFEKFYVAVKQDEVSVFELQTVFATVRTDLQSLGDTQAASHFLRSVTNAYHDKLADLTNPAKQLEVMERVLDNIPSSAGLGQQYETIRATIIAAPSKRSEAKEFWSNFYKTNEPYQSLENFMTKISHAKWLATAERNSLGIVVEKLSENRKLCAAPPVTDLDAGLLIVEQKRSQWELVKDDFKKFHCAVKKGDVTVAELDPLFTTLKNDLDRQDKTETGLQLLQQASGAYKDLMSAK